MTTRRLLTTSGNRKSSRKDWWLGARMAGPSTGTFSRPFTFGRYSSRRIGPRNTHFISHQYMASPTPAREPLAEDPRCQLYTLPASLWRGKPIHVGIWRSRMDVRGHPRAPGGRGWSIRAVSPGAAVPQPLPARLTLPPHGAIHGPDMLRAVNARVLPGAEAFRFDAGPIGALLQHGFSGCPASMRPFGQWLAEHGVSSIGPRLPGHGTTWQDLETTRWQDWERESEAAVADLASRCTTVIAVG